MFVLPRDFRLAPKPCSSVVLKNKRAIPELRLNCLPEQRPLLSLQEIRGITCWQDLKKSYEAKGISGLNDQAILARAKSDWSIQREISFIEAKSSPLPESYPLSTVTINGKPIDLYGTCHSLAMHGDLLAMLNKVTQNELLFTEQNLGRRGFSLYSNGFDIPDFQVRGVLQAIIATQSISLAQSMHSFGNKIAKFFKISPELPNFLYARTLTSEGRKIAANREKYGLADSQIAENSRLALTMPGDIFNDLPANIDIAYRHHAGQGYNYNLARSAFMAEFLRHLNVSEFLSNTRHKLDPDVVEKVSACKKFLCGHRHLPEIEFFLKNESQDAKITHRARHIAGLANKGGSNAIKAIFNQHNDWSFAFEFNLEILRQASIAALIIGSTRWFFS